MVNAHYLSYKKAWVELEVPKNDWQLLASPLKGMLSGEWYAPTGNARQETTYFEGVTFNTTDYDRYSPAVYQRSWDKAKAVLYEPGAAWSSEDNNQNPNREQDLGTGQQGEWVIDTQDGTKYNWNTSAADEYLQRITYKPFGQNKANVAVKGMWSNVFNDHSVKYDDGGFSVMVINYFKDGTTGHYTDKGAEKAAVFRLPKEDQYYDIWNWGQTTTDANRVRVYIKDDENDWPNGVTTGIDLTGKRWKLRSDDLSTATYFNITMQNEGNGSLGKFLVANPFICGLDVSKLIAETANSGKVNTEVTIPTKKGDEVYSYNNGQWKLNDTAATPIVEPGKAFWMTVPSSASQNSLTLSFTADMMTPAYTADGNGGSPASGSGNARPYSDTEPPALVITAERNQKRSSAVVSLGDGAQNEFVENEDVATFIDENRMSVPTIYTLCGRLATTVNRIQDFSVLPIGIESNDDAACTVTFRGVEAISADGLQLYDAVAQTQTPITSGTTVTLPGQTQNRFFLLGGTRTAIEAAEATHL